MGRKYCLYQELSVVMCSISTSNKVNKVFGKKENSPLEESFTFISDDLGVDQTSDPDENASQ